MRRGASANGHNHLAVRALLTIALTLAGLLAAPELLRAHAHLTRSTPSSGARLASPPAALTLWFSEAPELAFSRITLRGPDSATVSLGALKHVAGSPLAMSTVVESALAPGRYTVEWQTAAADGHPVRGRFSFTVIQSAVPALGGQSAPAARDTLGSAAAGPTDGMDAGAPLFIVVRWIALTSLLALIGVCVFQWHVLPGAGRLAETAARGELLVAARRELSRRATRTGLIAAVCSLAATLLLLFLQSYAMYGTTSAPNGGTMRAMLMHTTWGGVWILQLLAAIAAAVGFALALRRGTRHGAASTARLMATLAVVALAFTPALGGHAGASPRLASLAILADGLHVLGAGGWLGTLLVITIVVLPYAMTIEPSTERSGIVADVVKVFSPAALGFASLVVAMGLVSAWIHLGSLHALWSSGYGRVLVLKLVLIVPLLLIGAYNWRRVRPALGTADATTRLRRSAGAELAVTGLVLAVTAVLVAVQPPT